jgi:hypothetical protein
MERILEEQGRTGICSLSPCTSPEVATRVYTQEAPEEDAGGLATFPPYDHKRRVLLQIER